MTQLKNIIQRNLPEIILFLFLGIVVFSTINKTHDWGGDFAQYLDNARDLAFGQKSPQDEVLDSINFAPTTRGSGFSLLIAPIYILCGGDIKYFTGFLSLIFLFSILVIYRVYLKFGLNVNTAMVLSLFIALHPEILAIKLEILPTFPFLILLYLYFLYDKATTENNIWSLAVLAGLLISFRNVGWVLYLTVLMHMGLTILKNFQRIDLIRTLGFALIVPGVVVFMKWVVFGNVSTENLSWYQRAFNMEDQSVLWNRSLYYYDQLLILFKPGILGVASIQIAKLMIVLTLIGWCYRVYQKRWSKADTFVIIYGLLLLVYEGVSGLRFLIPVVPIILFYWVNGLSFVLKKMKEALVSKVKLITIGCFLILFLPNTYAWIQEARTPITGPNRPDVQEAFAYVRNAISEGEATAFHKPWVFHYYTGRRSLAISPKKGYERLTMDYLVGKMTRFGVKYLLVSIARDDAAIYNESLIVALQKDGRFTEQWRNNSFAFLLLDGDEIRNKNSALK